MLTLKMEKWCLCSKMVANYEKTKNMIINIRQKYQRLPEKELNVKAEYATIKSVQSEKLLGVNMDQHLTWKDHIGKVHKTVSMIVARFRMD